MIAVVEVRTPWRFSVGRSVLDAQPWVVERNGQIVRVYPPYQTVLLGIPESPFAPIPAIDQVELLGPRVPPFEDQFARIEGAPTVLCDGLRIEVQAEDLDLTHYRNGGTTTVPSGWL